MPRPTPPARCGCCDRLTVLALCEACDEPTCAEHLRRVGPIGAPVYVCAVCLEHARQQGAEEETPDLSEVLA